MSTFVLVHGAFHGGWCWHKVTTRLQKLGHTVVSPDMIGHGLDRTPPEKTSLDGLVDGIRAVVEAQAEPVILVGHSFGGTIISRVGELIPSKIKALVYLTAFVHPSGKAVLEINGEDAGSLMSPYLRMAPDNSTATIAPEGLRPVFYAQCSDDDLALAEALLVPEGAGAFSAPVITSAQNWGRIAHFYIECLRDRAIGIAKQREFASYLNKPKVFTLDTDHSPFFSMPGELTKCLAGL